MPQKSIDGADLATQLVRHRKRVTVTNLQKEHGDVAKTLHTHAAMVKADLLVIGAYAHSKLLQIVLGGGDQPAGRGGAANLSILLMNYV
jgi:nucleotide-binding universal stress UspA family protein